MARRAVSEAAAGEGRVVLIEGPPGIGKTRLLDVIVDLAARAGFEVQHACGNDLESSFAYGVLRQLLSPCLARLDPSVRAVVLEGPASAVAAMVDGAGGDSSAGSADAALGMAHGTHRLLQDLSERNPQLLCVDDAHWADTPSLETLGYLVRRLDGLPIVVAAGYRVPLDGRVGDRLARLQSVPGARRLTLSPLSEAAVAQLATAVVGGDCESGLPGRLWQATGGNPFLVHELLAALRAGEPAWRELKTPDVERLVPEPVSQAVLRRITATGERAARLADAVAVLGEAALRDAAALAELDEAEAVSAAGQLVAADVLAGGLRLRFVHPIVHEAVRAHIRPARRALAHARAARLLAERRTGLDRVAAHLLETLPRADPWVTETLLAAAEQQLRRGSPDTAVELLQRARDEPPPRHLRHPAILALARAQARIGHPQAVATAREAQAGARDPTEEAEATLNLVRTLGLSGDLWSALDLLHERTAGGSVIDPDLALQLEAELLGVARLQADTRDEALARLDRLSPRAVPPRRATRVLLANLALSALERNEHPDRIAKFAQMALAGGWPADEMSFQLVFAFEALTWIDRLDEATVVCDSAAAAARDSGSLALSGVAHGWRSTVNLRRGDVSDAEADARISYDLVAGLGASWRTPFARAPLADVLLVRGDLAEAEKVLGAPDPVEEAGDNPFYLDSRGRLHLAQGDARAALQDFLDCGQALGRRGGVDVPTAFAWRSQVALALLRLDDRQRAHELALEELDLATAGQISGAVGQALTVVGLVEDRDDGIRRLHQAVEALEDSPRVLARINALTELGAMLRRHRHPRAAREHLKVALDLAHRQGATAVADRARAELVIAGGRPRRAAITGLDALTPSERRVAQLIAQRLTNRQVAQALFVSPRTVTTHLTHIYQKLGISGRDELSAFVADQRDGRSEVPGASDATHA